MKTLEPAFARMMPVEQSVALFAWYITLPLAHAVE
jgi:hypothetical protein